MHTWTNRQIAHRRESCREFLFTLDLRLTDIFGGEFVMWGGVVSLRQNPLPYCPRKSYWAVLPGQHTDTLRRPVF